MSEKDIHLLALSEVRWPGHGVLHFGNHVILYSGSDTDVSDYCHRGVAVILSEKAVPAWKSAGSVCDLVSERILRPNGTPKGEQRPSADWSQEALSRGPSEVRASFTWLWVLSSKTLPRLTLYH